MSWGGAPIYVDQETEEFLFSCEVEREELAMWEEVLRKLGQKEENPVRMLH
ncbi:MAG: hypothetical protein NT170_00225 [Candidatus Moranbacteria bacterium]|nr:hypothetical protein [Candidatus Moranbacteria bacterium]